MDNDKKNAENNSAEEDSLSQEVEKLIKDKTLNFCELIFSFLSWSWPATILLFAVQQILIHCFSYYGLTFWGVTFFLWFPIVFLCGSICFFLAVIWIFLTFHEWIKFLGKIWRQIKFGFKCGVEGDDSEK